MSANSFPFVDRLSDNLLKIVMGIGKSPEELQFQCLPKRRVPHLTQPFAFDFLKIQ